MASSINERAAAVLRVVLRRKGIVATDVHVHHSILGPKLYKPGAGDFCLIELHTHKPGIFMVHRAGKRSWEKFRGLRSAARRAVDLYAACRKR